MDKQFVAQELIRIAKRLQAAPEDIDSLKKKHREILEEV